MVSKDEALNIAIERFTNLYINNGCVADKKCLEACKKALAQPAQPLVEHKEQWEANLLAQYIDTNQ